MENADIAALQKKIDDLNATMNKQHAEHLGWLNQMLQQENQMIAVQVGGLRQEQQSLKRALGITDANMPFEPYYNRGVELTSREPDIYNKYGERLHTVFLSDREGAHCHTGNFGRYLFCDRYNYGLKNHFYTHDESFRTVGKPINKFAMLNEARAIKPQSYENFLKNKAYIESEFKYVFTLYEDILNSLSNARLMILGSYHYGNYQPATPSSKESEFRGVTVSVDNWKNKTKNISIIASNKRMCRGHIVRQAFAQKCKKDHLADTFGQFDGGEYCAIELPFQYYRYSIAIENDISPYLFTEKITNCFAAMTIPVYLGASEIGKFFNPDGIITLKESDLDNLDEVLKQCTPQEYERRLPAVIDNYNRLMYYNDGNSGIDLLYKQFLRPFFEPQKN